MKRLLNAIPVSALLCCASAATAVGFEFGAYIQLGFGKDEIVFGLSGKPELAGQDAQELLPASDRREVGLHLQMGPETEPVFLLNGVALSRPHFLYQDAKSDSEDNQGVDWELVAAAAVGVALVAAIANADDASVSVCSGVECPPPKPEPDEPADE